MANAPSEFEQMITNNGPVQTSIIRNLTPWEFRNLQLAGIRIPVNRVFQRRHQTLIRCNERDPENPEERCPNTTELFEEIRACAGRPFGIVKGKTFMESWMGAEKTRPCIQYEPWKIQERRWLVIESQPGSEPNVRQYPIHTKVCRRCRDFYAAEQLNEQLREIADFRTPLCKWHSLEQARQSPLNVCRCLAFINDKWRCRRCYSQTLSFLNAHAGNSKWSLTNVRIPWSHPQAYLRSLWASRGTVCPIQGCFEQSWLDRTGERMQMCLGCNTIIRT